MYMTSSRRDTQTYLEFLEDQTQNIASLSRRDFVVVVGLFSSRLNREGGRRETDSRHPIFSRSEARAVLSDKATCLLIERRKEGTTTTVCILGENPLPFCLAHSYASYLSKSKRIPLDVTPPSCPWFCGWTSI